MARAKKPKAQINLKTTKVLGIAVPLSAISRADEVIK